MILEECLNRIIGRCPKCTRDYSSHPNNRDCPNYHPIQLNIYEVKMSDQDEITKEPIEIEEPKEPEDNYKPKKFK
jgi:hypothetical protein